MIPGEAVFGAAFGDYDNDGYPDVFFEDLGASGKLYRNRRNGTFIQTNQATNLTAHPAAQGAAWGDFNLDGKLDLFVSNDFGQNQLFKNLDNATFEDISLAAGVEAPGNSYGMAWGDFDNNGYPDVVIAPCSSAPQNSIKHLLRNNGDETFTNVNVGAGVNDSLMSWGVIWLDYNNDGHLDIFIANTEITGRPGHDRLYRNEGNGKFTNATDLAGIAGGANEDSYGVAAADFDNDGWIDIYVPNSGSLHKLYRNNGDGTFADIAASAGINELNHQSVAVADFDNDGWVDIFTAGTPQNKLLFNNGGANHWIAVKARGRTANYYGVGARVELVAGAARQMREITAGDLDLFVGNDGISFIYANGGAGSFTKVVTDVVILNGSWSSCTADYDGDGDVDLFVTNSSRRDILYANLGNANNWSNIKCVGTISNRAAIGAKVRIKATIAGKPVWQMREISGQTGYLSQNSLNAIFGLGDAEIIDSLKIEWPLGLVETFTNVPANRFITATEGQGITGVKDANNFLPTNPALEQNYPNPFNPTTSIRFAMMQPGVIRLEIYDLAGRLVRTLINNENKISGEHLVIWDGRDDHGNPVGSGVYFYRLFSNGSNSFEKTRKMVLLR
jgi:hypothetical protein